MFDPFILIVVATTFLLAGAVKGVIGLGLPTVSLGLLTATLGLPQAMTLLLIPSLATNLLQASSGGNGRYILRRIWPFLLMATSTVWLGALALTRASVISLSTMLGIVIVIYSILGIAGYRLNIKTQHETRLSLMLGALNGVLTGMTGSFVMPGILFLQGIGLAKDELIQAMGILFTISTIALCTALLYTGFLTIELGTVSLLALAPALAGMMIGRKLRNRLSEAVFRRVFFIALLLLGSYIILKALYSG